MTVSIATCLVANKYLTSLAIRNNTLCKEPEMKF